MKNILLVLLPFVLLGCSEKKSIKIKQINGVGEKVIWFSKSDWTKLPYLVGDTVLQNKEYTYEVVKENGKRRLNKVVSGDKFVVIEVNY